MLLELFVKDIGIKQKCVGGRKAASSQNQVIISNSGGLWLPGYLSFKPCRLLLLNKYTMYVKQWQCSALDVFERR